MIKLDRTNTNREWNGFKLKVDFGTEQIPKRGNMWQLPSGKLPDVWQFTISEKTAGN